jgi:osmoprotectant transport system permease protein
MATHLTRDVGEHANHRAQLGGTQVLWKALLKGEIDVYPEYTGTLEKDIVKGQGKLEDFLEARGVRLSRSVGFSNSYALGMRAEQARRLGIKNITDLRSHSGLRYGFDEEFRNRDDGWGSLQRHYGLRVPEDRVKVLDHDLTYRGLKSGDLDVIDVYTTDGEIGAYDVLVLADDRKFFPRYDAVWVYRTDLPAPVVASLKRLEGRISETKMQELNLEARLHPGSESAIAADFLKSELGLSIEVKEETLWERLLRRTGEHLFLVLVSLGAAIVVAVPLGVLAAKRPLFGQAILSTTGVLQTVPTLALLVFLIPLFGLGWKPAVVALFLYSLLPIVRNTHAGLVQIPASVRESAAALGLPPGAVLRLVELPLALRSILAGIKTAAVINVGTATLGALIGAGGHGQPILSGIRLDDHAMILEGAIPAALLALAVQGLFELIERALTPRGLRLS